MNKLCKRLLVFFLGLPLVLGLVFLNYANHLVLNFVIVVFSVLAASEFYNFAPKNTDLFNKYFFYILVALLPLSAYLFNFIGLDINLTSWLLVAEICILFATECFAVKSFENSVNKISFSVLLLFYCGYLLTFLVKLTTLPNSTYFLILFFILVFMCDSGAWFFGMLFGKSTRGFIPASPNKSLVGFIGGIITSIACGILLNLIFPEIFGNEYWKIIIISFLTAVVSIVGDLTESVFKRSAEIKDSGTLIPGRGGVLDSIDSIILATPIYYTLIHFFYFL